MLTERTQSLTDPLAEVCKGILSEVINDISYGEIVSIGLPRILEPHTSKLKDWPIQIFEKYPENSFNISIPNLNSEELYTRISEFCRKLNINQSELESNALQIWYKINAFHYLVDKGFNTTGKLKTIHTKDIASWTPLLPSIQKYLLILDTTQLNHLESFVRRRMSLPPGSVFVLNSNNIRNKGSFLTWANRIDPSAQLIFQADYPARASGGTRTVSFFRK